MPHESAAELILKLTEKFAGSRQDLIAQASFSLRREQWCQRAEDWLEDRKEREALQAEARLGLTIQTAPRKWTVK